MIEKIGSVNNPLTIIAIFAGLAEIAGTIVLGVVDKSIQEIFVWFVMLFPMLIVLLFFITLNFNPKVLYAPSDFKNEENFLETFHGAQKIVRELDEIDTKVDEFKQTISNAPNDINVNTHVVDNLLDTVSTRIISSREVANMIANRSIISKNKQDTGNN